jgi:integrase/recombinase XerD
MMESANAGAFRNVPGKRAPVLTAFQVKQVERYIRTDANNPFADLLKFRLSVYAGLRVSEITNISIADMVGADGAILPEITIRAAVGKGGKQRKIPMHPKITEALQQFRRAHPDMPYCGFSMRWYTPKRQKVNALTNQMCLMYRRAGLPQHSSHSGRRTFITNLARNIGRKYTLRDVQLLAGHARLDTTELYIEPSSNIVDLVGSLK